MQVRPLFAYIGSLEKAQLGGSKDDYLKIISKSVSRSLDIYLRAVKGEDDDQEADDDQLLKIGELAKQSDETVATIRYWTKEGLLQVAETTASNYALYSPDMLKRVEKIQELKKQRYTIKEIKDSLS